MLEPWINSGWSKRDYPLALPAGQRRRHPRPGRDRRRACRQPSANTFFHSPEALPLLEASLYSGVVAYRILGPQEGENNLFSWDSGFGAGSLARPPLLRIVTGPAPSAPPPSPTPKVVIVPPQSGENLLAWPPSA